jgi:hypothetical protein
MTLVEKSMPINDGGMTAGAAASPAIEDVR